MEPFPRTYVHSHTYTFTYQQDPFVNPRNKCLLAAV